MSLLISIYFWVGFFWGLYATDRHALENSEDSNSGSKLNLLLVFMVNALLWPIAIPMGMYRGLKKD